MDSITPGSDGPEIRRRLAQRQELAAASEIAAIKAELAAERAAEERLAGGRREVADARTAADGLHGEAAVLARDIADLAVQVAARTQRLEAVRAQLGKQAHIEGWWARENPAVCSRCEIDVTLPIAKKTVAALYKAARALAQLAGRDPELDQIHGQQTGWATLTDGS